MNRLWRNTTILGFVFLAGTVIHGCGTSTRDFKGHGSGTAGDAASAGESAEGGQESSAGSGGSADGGASEGGASGADGGMSGEGGAAGADCGEACGCEPDEQRSCAVAGLLGSCGAGVQACGTDRQWGTCSIHAKSKDTCTLGNDDNCNGVVNEGCPCVQGQQRPCSDGGSVGKCATGKQTCAADATWGACSIVPAAADSCVLNNNDNCAGPANEGCLCIEGVTTRPCGVCQDGTQTCSNGKAGQYGACVGGTAMTTYYLDADGDGHAVNVSTTVCGPAPTHYITGPVDDCYDSNAAAFPGQTGTFNVNRGDGSFDYDCINGEEPTVKKGDEAGCATCSASCGCATPNILASTPACGTDFGVGACYGTPGCGLHSSGAHQYCH